MIELHGLQALVNFMEFLILYALCGLFIARAWLVPQSVFDDAPLSVKWNQMQRECLTLFTSASVLVLFVRTAEMDDGTLATVFGDLPYVLTKTHFGVVWAVHLGTLAVLWMGSVARSGQANFNRWRATSAVTLLVLAFTYSATSHASDAGDFTFAEFNDWIHVVATAIWGGSILVSAILVFPTLRTLPALLAEIARRLSNLSACALAAVLLTGICNALLQFPISDAPLQTNYGRILVTKLGIVACIILIGVLNRTVISSRLNSCAVDSPSALAGPLRLLTRALAVDVAFVLLAITMAAVLMQSEAV